MEKTRGFLFIACIEAAIFAAGYIVSMLYPDASIWVWLIVLALALFGAWVFWPSESKVSTDADNENRIKINKEREDSDTREMFWAFAAPYIPLVPMFVFAMAALILMILINLVKLTK